MPNKSSLRRALALLLSVLMLTNLLGVTAFAEEGTQEGTTRTLMDNGLKNESDWTWTLASNAATNAPNPVFDGNGGVTIVGSGANNTLAYNGTIEANNFDVSFVLTPHMTASACANDVKIRLKVGDSSYLQVRFKFKEGVIYAETADGATDLGTYNAFTWTTDVGLNVKISLNDNILTVAVDNQNVIATTAEQIDKVAGAGTAWGSFAIVSQFPNQDYSVSNLYITTTESESTTEPEPNPDPDPEPDPEPEPTHITPLSQTLVSDSFENGDNWDVTSSSIITFANGAATIKGSGPNNRMGYNKGTINANNFLIQLDYTHGSGETGGSNTKIAFKCTDQYEGDRLQVRFLTSGSDCNKICIECTSNNGVAAFTKTWSESFDYTFELGRTYGVDVLVSGNTITVYIDGVQIAEVTNEKVSTMSWGYFAIAGQYATQDFTIDNLLITTNDDVVPVNPDPVEPDPDPEPEPDPEPTHIDALNRVLLPGSALNSSEDWDILTSNASTITIADGTAAINGSGPINRMGYNVGILNAGSFLIQLDLTPGAGNTNSNTKIAFKCTDKYEGDRLQVRFNFPDNLIYVEETSNNSEATFTKEWSESATFTATANQTYGVDVLVSGSTITVYINTEQIISVTRDEIGAMAKGYFAIAGQYPEQDFTISNLRITTNEEQTGEQYTVTTEVSTDGDRGNTAGGALTANPTTGYSGDVIELTPTPAHGYVFSGYTSYMTDTSASTDGLMPINNNKFTLDEKFGNVTVVANFTKRVAGKFELYYDDFGADSLDSTWKTVGDRDAITQDGELTIETTSSNYALLDQSIFDPLKDGEGYRISVDATRTSGTMQIMFKGSDDNINGRYVLVLNGSVAVFRYIDPTVPDGQGTLNVALTQANYNFPAAGAHLELEVKGSTATLYADGVEIVSHTSTDGWLGEGAGKGTEPKSNAVGLINMTKDAVMTFDNLLVERIPEELPVNVTTMLGDDEDADYAGGAAAADMPAAVAGDVVALTSVAKAGYALQGYTVTSGGVPIPVDASGTFTVPDGASGSIEVTAVFKPVALRAARSFYIDSENGDDSGEGTIASPWKTLGKLTAYTAGDPLVPGDTVYLKRGSVFTAQVLSFSGMGSASAPVTITAYGDGSELPLLAGDGQVENVVSLYNQEYITISDLQITNTSASYNSTFGLNTSNNTSLALRAINVSAKDFGTVNGITIQNCYIHDINGNINLKWNGGIFFDVQATVVDMVLCGVPTKYDGILIEGCTFINVDRSGIKLVNSAWCNQWLKNDGTKPINWYPSTNTVIRNNYMEKIGGDGITTRDTDGTLIEYNLTKDCRYQNSAYNVAIWPFQAANTVIQYNEAYDTHSTQDGQGLDCDHASSYTVMQYNYSHNNEGGFMLIMGGYPHTAATVRYNLSVNDRDKAFEFAQGIPMGTMIYNNTLYSSEGVNNGILYLSNTSAGVGVNDVYLFNNLFCYPAGQPFYCSGSYEAAVTSAAQLYNNAYVGGITAPSADASAVTVADSVSVFAGAGAVPKGEATPITGSSAELAGYQLAEGSPLIDKGVTLAEAIAYFGGDIETLADHRSDSPNELFYRYYGVSGKKSLDYVMGGNFPNVSGVDYTLDFFGNRNQEGAAPDIGAAEYLQHTHSGGTATCSTKAICDICGVAYGELDPNNHVHTEVRGAVAATATQAGYSGDIYCADCGGLLEAGHVIPATGSQVQPVTPVVPSVPIVTPTQPDEPTQPDMPVAEMPFTDVAGGAYYYDAVLWAAGNGITTGTGAATFSPDTACTRGQIVTFLWRAAGCPEPTSSDNPFADVAGNAYYYTAVLWAVENGITVGTSVTTFSPDMTATRGQVVTFLYRYAGFPTVSGGNDFADVPANAYYANAVQWAVTNEVTYGTSATTFSPEKKCIRAESVTLLYRCIAK